MYGWIVDGISSLFEPLSGQKLTECPAEESGRSEGSVRGGNSGRAAKRSYHSIDINESEVESKRRKRDVVLSFVKKTVAGVAGLLRLRRPVKSSQQQSQYEDPQLVTPMGIDELHTSCFIKSDWRMDKPGGARNPLKTSSPPLMRKHSGGGGLADRDRRGSLQLLLPRPAVRLGVNPADPVCSSYSHNRCYKPSLTVEETIRQNDREHYRRLLEMVSEKYSKNQPLPFNQSKPQDELLKTEHAITRKPFGPKKSGQTVGPGVFSWRNQTPRGRDTTLVTRMELSSTTMNNFLSLEGALSGPLETCNSFSGPVEDPQHARTTKKQNKEEVLSTDLATLSLADKSSAAACLPKPYSTHSTRAIYAKGDIPRLSKEMAAEVSSALSQKDPNLVLSAAFKQRITQRDLVTLVDEGWLNDEVINFYLSLVMDRSSGGGLRVYSFSTFFLPRLRGRLGGEDGGHKAVKRWTKAVDLFLHDLILVPVHLGVHWALAVIDLKSKTLNAYDSMGQRHEALCRLLLLYLQEEHRVKKGRELDVSKWTLCSTRLSEIPQQKNCYDCGVFVCKYADYIARGRPLTFDQRHMSLFRKLIIWEILHQKLL